MLDTPSAPLLVDASNLPFRLDVGIARRAAIGLIVLATDNTIEHEWRALLGGLDGVAFYESRLPNAATINQESLAAMAGDIAAAAALIRPGERIDVMGFGCTSGTMVIGEDAVFARLRTARPGVACTSPITAGIAALHTMRTRRIALLTPYVDPVNRAMRAYIAARGLDVPVMGSFNHDNDNEVARIDAGSIEAAAVELGRHPEVEAVFVSCTSLRVAGLVERIEDRLGKPVTSSNHAMAWHALRLAGVAEPLPGRGRLFRH